MNHQNEDEKLPDTEQLAAISTRHKNVEVVARAGSGKTTTIISRARFLIDNCGVDPTSILLLAFNKKAVEEMEERLEKVIGGERLPFVMTFHALAYSIVHPQEDIIFDNPETNDGTLSRVVQSIIDKKIRDKNYVERIRNLMISMFKDAWRDILQGGYNLSKDEMIMFRKSLKKETMKGERVNSDEDRVLANALFEHDTEYKYIWSRKQGRLKSSTQFIVNAPNDSHIVLEVLKDIEADNSTIKAKKDYWGRKKGYYYFMLRSDIVLSDEQELIATLRNILNPFGVPFIKLSAEEIWRRIRDRAIDQFTDAVRTFIGRCRKLEITSFELAKMVRNHLTINEVEKHFLDIVQDIYKEYLEVLNQKNLEDFDGLMSRASNLVNDGRHVFKRKGNKGFLEDLKHILIDEYQDFSYLFNNFLELIRKVCPEASIFCVGDDWQAINGFAGSDVKYFTGFLSRYEDSKRYHITTNYRSVPTIVKSSNALMSRFRDGNAVHASRGGDQEIRLGYYKDMKLYPQEWKMFFGDEFKAALLRLVSSFLKKKQSVAVLSRTNKEIEGMEKYLQSFFPEEDKGLISVSTTHKYKGKQKSAVIVIDAEVGRYPLINPAWIFNRIFGDTEQKLIDDERRLFYVAITRAENDLILLANENEESPFLDDMPKIQIINWDDYPPMKSTEDGSAESHVKVTVSNQPGYWSYPYPTVKIKDLLKQAKFSYDGQGSWFKFYPLTDNLTLELLEEPWARAAQGVSVLVRGDDGSLIETLNI